VSSLCRIQKKRRNSDNSQKNWQIKNGTYSSRDWSTKRKESTRYCQEEEMMENSRGRDDGKLKRK